MSHTVLISSTTDFFKRILNFNDEKSKQANDIPFMSMFEMAFVAPAKPDSNLPRQRTRISESFKSNESYNL